MFYVVHINRAECGLQPFRPLQAETTTPVSFGETSFRRGT